LINNDVIAQTAWQLKKNKEGIEVYTRKIKGSKFKEYKAITKVDGTVQEIVQILQDPSNFDKWMPDTTGKLLEMKGDSIQIHHAITKAPWPVKSRDGIYQFQYWPIKEGMLIKMTCLPSYLPKVKGKIRIPSGSGFWKLKHLSANKVAIHYQFHADPGGNIPAWVSNMASVDLPFESLKNLRNRLKN